MMPTNPMMSSPMGQQSAMGLSFTGTQQPTMPFGMAPAGGLPAMQNPFAASMGASPYQPGTQVPTSSVNSTTTQNMTGQSGTSVPFGQVMGQLGLLGSGMGGGMLAPQVSPQNPFQPQVGGQPLSQDQMAEIQRLQQALQGTSAFNQMNQYGQQIGQQSQQAMQNDPRFQRMQQQLDRYGSRMNPQRVRFDTPFNPGADDRNMSRPQFAPQVSPDQLLRMLQGMG